jgi:hypothetical protein
MFLARNQRFAIYIDAHSASAGSHYCGTDSFDEHAVTDCWV